MVSSRESSPSSLEYYWITDCPAQMDEAGIEKEKPSIPEVVADGVLSIIAGSDTTSMAISR